MKGNGWKQIELSDPSVAKLIMGQSPPSSTYNPDGNGMPFYQGKKEFGNLYPTPEVFCTEPSKIAEKGDILLSVRAPVGPTNLCPETSCIGRGLAAIRPNSNNVSTSFLLYYFKFFESVLASKGQGSTFDAISKKVLEKLLIPLPPLPEQRRIVAKLDSLFERIDKAIALVEENIKNAQSFMASVLNEVFKGLSAFHESKTVQELSHKIQYGFTGKTSEHGQYRYLRITDIQNSKVDWNSTPFAVIPEQEVQKYLLLKGDIVFTRTGATTGKSYLFVDDVPSIFASYLIRVVVRQDLILPEFLYLFFQSPHYWQQIMGKVVGAAQPNVNGQKLAQLSLPVPTLAKQTEIIHYLAFVQERQRFVVELQQKRLSELTTLKSSLLDAAFKGEL